MNRNPASAANGDIAYSLTYDRLNRLIQKTDGRGKSQIHDLHRRARRRAGFPGVAAGLTAGSAQASDGGILGSGITWGDVGNFLVDRHEMDTLFAAAFLGRQFVNLLIALWPAGAILIGLIIIAAFINRPISRRDMAKSLGYTTFLLIVAFTILLIGAAAHQPTLTHPNIGYQEPSPWVIQATVLLLIIHIAAGGVFVWQARGYRFFAVALAIFNIWLALISTFLARMAITGSWL